MLKRDFWSTVVFKENLDFNILNDQAQNISVRFGSRQIRRSKIHIHTIADPFLFKKEDRLYLFAEIQSVGNKGYINSWSTIDGNSWKDDGPIFVKDFHTSFPFIFFENGEDFFVPEQVESQKTCLYKFQNFPNNIQECSTISYEPIEDPIIIKKQSTYFLIGTYQNKIRLLYSDSLNKNNWAHHPMNNMIESKIIRNAGPPMRMDQEYLRFTQDNRKVYGGDIFINKIICLNKDNFEEVVLKKMLKPKSTMDFDKFGRHHLSTCNFKGKKFIAIDGRSKDLLINKFINFCYKVLD
jgi:hypothetical protein